MPTSSNPIARVADAATRGPQALARAANLLPRVTDLLDVAERLPGRVDALLERIDVLLRRLETTIDRLDAVVTDLTSTGEAATTVVNNLSGLVGRADVLASHYEPGLHEAADAFTYAATTFGREEVEAIAAYLKFLPLLQALERDVVPVMGAMGSVAPDLSELLVTSRTLNEMLSSLPGLGRAKKRADAHEDDDG